MHNDTRSSSPPRGIRRLVTALGSRFASHRFVFSLACIAVLGGKVVHIVTHLSALPTVHLVRWGYSFFAQDLVLIILLRLLLGGWLASSRGEGGNILRRVANTVGWTFVTFVTVLNVVGICFFFVTGAEIHWRNIGLAGDAAGRAILLTGLVTFAFVVTGLALLAWVLKDVLFVAAGLMADIVSWPVQFAARRRPCGARLRLPLSPSYAEIPQHDLEHGGGSTKETTDQQALRLPLNEGWDGVRRWPWVRLFWIAGYILAGAALLAQVIMCSIRPHESSLTFMSWTPTLLPFVDFKNSSPNLEKLEPVFGSGIGRHWDERTALQEPIHYTWLPTDPVPGFEDWYENKTHYSAAADPLKISNLEDKLLPELRALKGKLKDVSIRHVMVIALESTRKDMFPIKLKGASSNRFADSHEDKKLTAEEIERLRTLTPVARFLTGDHDDGFEHPKDDKNDTRSRGGLNFNDAYSTSTYTLKSLVGTLCGVAPLVADFNLEYLHHIYQPCLPHIFDALNTLDKDGKWTSSFMQSVTLKYDKFYEIMRKIGFPAEGLIDSEYLRSSKAKFGKVDLPNVNYFGMQETPLEDYMRDQFETAKKDNGRVFLTHITSTSHHPYHMPDNETYVPLGRGLDDLSHYVNAIGYDDRWLGRVLALLEQLGVADETLVVLVGDHGLSIPENDVLASYYNPNVGSNHVPLVLSHPKLPPITIDAPVSSQQILPTVLDLLLETGSLSGEAKRATGDLLANYEGQSLIRPVKASTPEVASWHFTVINPGRAMLGVRDARQKAWRMVVPVLDNVEWRFSDIEKDPGEKDPVLGFDFKGFLMAVQEAHGKEAARWAEEAAFVARWWVEENSKRWRYGPYASY
ncbi:sulfatase domain protein [Colletotrichum plurivorum]|uniref:Sulfatase domain protein n=1 Tax=Colletotrichum plurivorum TaxID=2175906 RepID=A0A8H6KFK2_9PEZI|nr:sulfatase domain protein [Colletotrichum plurivorum]